MQTRSAQSRTVCLPHEVFDPPQMNDKLSGVCSLLKHKVFVNTLDEHNTWQKNAFFLLHWAAGSRSWHVFDPNYTCVLESSLYAPARLQWSVAFCRRHCCGPYGNHRETHFWIVSIKKCVVLQNRCCRFNIFSFILCPSSQRSNPKYKDSPPEAIFVNVLGVLLVVFGALILWIATRASWKRPSDHISHTLHTNGGSEDNTKVGPAGLQLSNEADAEACGDVRRRSNKPDDQAN